MMEWQEVRIPIPLKHQEGAYAKSFMKDEQIIDLFWQRDRQAILETEKSYSLLLLQLARNITSSREDAEECVNDTYLKLWNAIPPNRPASLRNYAAALVRNQAIDRYRKNLSGGRPENLISITEELEDAFGQAENGYDSLEFKEILNAFLGQLDKKSRVLFVCRYWQAASVKEIAARFHMKESAVKMRLARTREKLRKYLGKEGIYI